MDKRAHTDLINVPIYRLPRYYVMLIGSIPGDLSASGYEQHFGSGLLVAHENGWSTLF